MLAILYDRIRGDEKLLFEAADRLGLAWKKVYLPQLRMDLKERPAELEDITAALFQVHAQLGQVDLLPGQAQPVRRLEEQFFVAANAVV